MHEPPWHIDCQEEFKPRVYETPRPMQACVSCSGSRPTTCDPHALGDAQYGEQRRPDLKHIYTIKSQQRRCIWAPCSGSAVSALSSATFYLRPLLVGTGSVGLYHGLHPNLILCWLMCSSRLRFLCALLLRSLSTFPGSWVACHARCLGSTLAVSRWGITWSCLFPTPLLALHAHISLLFVVFVAGTEQAGSVTGGGSVWIHGRCDRERRMNSLLVSLKPQGGVMHALVRCLLVPTTVGVDPCPCLLCDLSPCSPLVWCV